MSGEKEKKVYRDLMGGVPNIRHCHKIGMLNFMDSSLGCSIKKVPNFANYVENEQGKIGANQLISFVGDYMLSQVYLMFIISNVVS